MTKSFEKLPLGAIASFKSGGTPSKSHSDFWGGKYPWVSAKDLKSIVITESISRLSCKGFLVANIAPKNSLLILVRGMTLHKKVPVCIAGKEVAFNQDIKALLVSDNVVPEYLLYFLHSQEARLLNLVNNSGHGTGRLDTDSLKNFPILIPSLPEQTFIASLLSTWDEAIEKTEKLIEAKEERFKWLLNTLLKQRSQKGEWRRVKLGEVFGKELVIEKGKALIKNNISEGKIPVVAGGKSYAYYHNYTTHEMPTITISASGAYAGFVWHHNYPIWASDCNVIYSNNASIEFYYYVLKSLQRRIYSLQSGGAQPHIYVKDLKNLVVPVPPVETQKQIANNLNTAQQEIDLLKKQAEAYRKQKRGLMQKLLIGQWRVKINGEVV